MTTPLLVTLAVLVAGAGYWAVKVRQRADAATVAAQVGREHPGARLACSELQANGSVWGCTVAYQAEYLCVLANVSVTGGISTAPGRHRCDGVPELKAIVPARPTAAAVEADVTRFAPGPKFACVRPGAGTSRWVCGRRAGSVVDCRLVALLPWQPLKLKPGGDRCLKLPALQLGP
jgi:hypothetical protein